MSKDKEIKLDDNWVIIGEEYKWELISTTELERNKLGKDRKPTGETEMYNKVETWYFPKIKMCLKKYLEESLKSNETVEMMVEKLVYIENMIEKL